MSYKIIVEDYGKIKKTEIEVLPLTLFVGDNNAGKSYLLSLLWAIFSGEVNPVLYKRLQLLLDTKYKTLYQKILKSVSGEDSAIWNKEVVIEKSDIIDVINDLLEVSKDDIVKSIFNYEGMHIGKIKIISKENKKFYLSRKKLSLEKAIVSVREKEGKGMGFQFPDTDTLYERIAISILENMIEMVLQDGRENGSYYLPAARTGFILAKNTINQVGRRKTFDVLVEKMDVEKENEITPFPKPIIHFLEAIDSLDYNRESKDYAEVVRWIEDYMSCGEIECIENSGDFQYIPMGGKEGIPLRATSAVVTEITPLLLLLKYAKQMKTICYEEPEMCLHPQLQLKMAQLLIRLVNVNINIIATTHSDIIVQHINNMCQLNAGKAKKDMSDFVGLEISDLIDIEKVAIYQFKDEGESTKVERLIPKNNAFEVPSFMQALGKILEQSINVSEFLENQEE